MFGFLKDIKGQAADMLLSGVKADIKKRGIKFIVAIPNEDGSINTRGFTEKMYFITEEMLNRIQDETLKKAIVKINTPK